VFVAEEPRASARLHMTAHGAGRSTDAIPVATDEGRVAILPHPILVYMENTYRQNE
jgi:hypothetical protein